MESGESIIGMLGIWEVKSWRFCFQSDPYNLWMMQSKGPCWVKGLLGSTFVKTMPFWEAWERREGWMKVCSFLGVRA